ncbi:hypothetical protein [Butyrivibrio sp.]|jgi:hypothetical protein|uniref:hypothetical protein n=1 Tax=Butyrivibrio sp. TaxID=28121 RepID=UPI0025C71AA3|nr:hypothetical protein [Butyrivibrio sp.]
MSRGEITEEKIEKGDELSEDDLEAVAGGEDTTFLQKGGAFTAVAGPVILMAGFMCGW